MEAAPLATLFTVLNTTAAVGWGLLIFFPDAGLTRRVVHNGILPVFFAAFYAAILAVSVPELDVRGFNSLSGVMALFSNANIALLGWVHYLCFDLCVGGWIARDSQERGIPHAWTVPCLFFTFMFGPVGLLLYLALRRWKGAAIVLPVGGDLAAS